MNMGRVKLDWKECTICMEIKDLDEFYKTDHGKPNSFCKECAKIKARAAHKAYKTKLSGSIYAISNPAWPGYLKVGRAVDIDNRLRSYQTCSPFRDYIMIFSVEISDLYLLENYLYNKYEFLNEWVEADLNILKEDIMSFCIKKKLLIKND